VHLPRVSDPRDIDEFVAKLEAFEKGEITSEQFRAFRLLRGVYGQRQENAQMLRVKIPFGRLGRRELDALADVADQFSRGFGHVTTRQNVQFHFLAMKDVEAAMRRLDEAGLTTREACGHSVRNVTACEHGATGRALFDPSPYAEAVVRLFLGHPLSSSLPRKFKIAFSGCVDDCMKAHIHDLGFIARVENGERGFKVVCAGGLSSSPQAAITLHEFVRASEIGRVGEAILRLFHALGNRENKHRARLKYVLRKLGEEAFRARYAEVRATVDLEAAGELSIPEPPKTTPAPPVVRPDAERAPGYLAWRASSVVDQKESGHAAVYVRLKLGDVTSREMRELGRIVDTYGDGTLRLTIDQNVLLGSIDRRSLPALHGELSDLGLARLDIHTARDVTSCQGADTCNLAVTSSRALAAAIMDRLDQESLAELSGLATTTIKVSGCPHSCGQHHVADLGWHGGAKTVNGRTAPVYQLHLGGGVDAHGARFGRQIVKIIARRVPDAVVELLRLFERDRAPGETPASYFGRVEAKRVTEVLAPFTGPPTTSDEMDIGQSGSFLVHAGEGECAA
jgi:sulfite reductase beta subunit-like hemoprotein